MTDFEEFIRDEKLTRLHQTHTTPEQSSSKQEEERLGSRGQKRRESYDLRTREHERMMQEKQQKLKELQDLLESVTSNSGGTSSPRKGEGASDGIAATSDVRVSQSLSDEQFSKGKGNYYSPMDDSNQYHGGGGAPLRDPITGQKRTRLNGRAYYDKLGSRDSAYQRRREEGREYLQKLMLDIEIQGERKKEETRKLHEETTDMASWIRARDHTQRHVSNGSHESGVQERQNKEALRSALTMQAEERHRLRELERLRDQYEARKYADMFPTLWGRERRLEKQEPRFDARASAESPQQSRPIYPKGTLTSNHFNRYENEQTPRKVNPNGHVLEPPWGSQS